MVRKKKNSFRIVSIIIVLILLILSILLFLYTIFWVMPINIIKYMVIAIILNFSAIIVIKRIRLFTAIPAYILIAVLIIRLLLALSTEIHMRYYGTLYEAVHTGNAKVVQLRIDDGCDVNETINNKPLICSVFRLYAYRDTYEPAPSKNVRQKNIVEILKVLIDNGANVNAIDKKVRGWSALFWAVADFNKEAVELLANNGADVTLTDEDGYTPLHYAQIPEMVQILIDKGADVNAIGKDGNTPLHMEPIVEVAQILISHGANVKAKNKRGETPLDIAIKEGNEELDEFLRKHGAK